MRPADCASDGSPDLTGNVATEGLHIRDRTMSLRPSHPIGLIGVGLLGMAIARRLLGAGLAVRGFDLDASRHEALTRSGGLWARSAEEAAAGAGFVVLCLPTSGDVAVLSRRIVDVLPQGAIVVDATTGDPEDSVRTARLLAARGIGYLDAAVSGSSEELLAGRGVLLIGGEVSTVERALPVLEPLSARRFHVGPCGSGARMKLVSNLVLGLNRAALAEALALAQRCGIDGAMALEVLQSGPAWSRAMDQKGKKMLQRDFSPQARLRQHRKDVALIRELGAGAGACLPLTEEHERLLDRAIAAGFADADNCAIIMAYDPPAGDPNPGDSA